MDGADAGVDASLEEVLLGENWIEWANMLSIHDFELISLLSGRCESKIVYMFIREKGNKVWSIEPPRLRHSICDRQSIDSQIDERDAGDQVILIISNKQRRFACWPL